MPRSRIRPVAIALSLLAAQLACTDKSSPRSDVTPADVVAGRVPAFEHFVSPSGKFAIDFPETWRGFYSAVGRPDTTGGARMAVEFYFKPDPAWKVEPRTLIAVRIFTRAAWERLDARPGPKLAAKLAARGDDVFALSLPPGNPYPNGSPASARFEELMQSFLKDPAGLRLTPR
jgi:hypothetical protein